MERIKLYFWPIIALCVGGFLRIFRLDYKGVDHDEVVSWLLATRPSLKELALQAGIDNTPPLYHLFLRYWLEFFSLSDFNLRLLSVLFGMGSLIIIYRLAAQLGGRQVANAAILLLSTNYYGIYFSQYARSAEFFSFLSLLTFSAWFYLLKEGFSYKRGLLFGLGMVLVCYTHYFGIFLVLSLFIIQLYQFLQEKKDKKFILPYLMTALLYFPWAWKFIFFRVFQTENFWIDEVSLRGVSHILGFFFNSYFFAGIALLICLGCFWQIFKKREWSRYRNEFIMGGVLSLFLGLALIKSLLTTSVFLDRYFIPCLGLGLVLFASLSIKLLGEKWGLILTLIIAFNAGDNFLFRRGYYERASELDKVVQEVDKVVGEKVILLDNVYPGLLKYFKARDGLMLEDHYINLTVDKDFSAKKFHFERGHSDKINKFLLSYRKKNIGRFSASLYPDFKIISKQTFRGPEGITLLSYGQGSQ